MEQGGSDQQVPQEQSVQEQSVPGAVVQGQPATGTGPQKPEEPSSEPQRSKTGVIVGAATAVAVILVALGVWGGKDKPTPGKTVVAGQPGASLDAANLNTGAGSTAQPLSQGQTAPVAPGTETASDTSSGQQSGEVVAPAPQNSDVVTFDLLRAAPNGSVTLAGKVAPGAKVEVLIDGAVVDTVTAGADGSFVSIEDIAPSAEARKMQVRVTGADGVAKLSEQALTVAPSAQAVAQAAVAAGASSEEAAQQAQAAQDMAARPVITDAEGARVLASASDQLVIDTLAVDAMGKVDISGRGAPKGAVLRAYVDNAEFGLASPAQDGSWRMELPPAKEGDHVLRVDALDAQGKVVSRAEQAFSAEAPILSETVATAADGTKTRVVRIEKGATLWAIARATYGDPLLYVRVFEANKSQIRNPDLIYPGQVFTLPQ